MQRNDSDIYKNIIIQCCYKIHKEGEESNRQEENMANSHTHRERAVDTHHVVKHLPELDAQQHFLRLTLTSRVVAWDDLIDDMQLSLVFHWRTRFDGPAVVEDLLKRRHKKQQNKVEHHAIIQTRI